MKRNSILVLALLAGQGLLAGAAHAKGAPFMSKQITTGVGNKLTVGVNTLGEKHSSGPYENVVNMMGNVTKKRIPDASLVDYPVQLRVRYADDTGYFKGAPRVTAAVKLQVRNVDSNGARSTDDNHLIELRRGKNGTYSGALIKNLRGVIGYESVALTGAKVGIGHEGTWDSNLSNDYGFDVGLQP